MSYSLYGASAAVVLVLVIGVANVAGGSNWAPAKASIYLIDRNCRIIESTYGSDYKRKSTRVYTDSCSSIDQWQKVRKKRDKDVSGTAVVHLNYTVPQTGQSQTGDLKFDGHDDEFYQLKAGDEIDILVSKSNPRKIRKA